MLVISLFTFTFMALSLLSVILLTSLFQRRDLGVVVGAGSGVLFTIVLTSQDGLKTEDGSIV